MKSQISYRQNDFINIGVLTRRVHTFRETKFHGTSRVDFSHLSNML